MKKFKNIILYCTLLNSSLFISLNGMAQANPLIERVSQKLGLVNDYVAEGVMKTDVSFIKASLGKVKVYFKKPNLLKVKKEGGISLLPRGGVSLTINTLLNTKQYTTIAAGSQVLNGKNLTVIKLIPTDDNLDWVISTLWIDPIEALVYKTATTTKENGSYEITMQYGEYANQGLASKIIFSFNTKDYKLPNGITLEFGDEDPASKQKALKNKKGTIEITYSKYTINKGIPASIFN
jgi:outer membrane lipoprotein-sorting protein